MWFKEAVLKALGDVLGKWTTEIQGVIVEELRGQLWREVRLGTTRASPILSHIHTYGTLLYQSGTRLREPSGETIPIRMLYRYNGHFVCVTRTETTTTLFYSRGLDFDKLWKLASLTANKRTEIWHGKVKSDLGIEWHPNILRTKDLYRGKETQALEADLLRWLGGERVFRQAGLPHRRGWLLYGKPGNGKTSAIQQLASSHGLHISVPIFHRGHMYMPHMTSKSFLLIEDIDNIFRGREPLNPDADFGNFLNAIDGVNDLDNCIVVITTNDLSAIDPAIGRPRDETQWNSLSTRPGRIDRCIYFDNPDQEARLGIARKMLPENEAVRMADDGDGLSVAQFSALVRERAMEVVSEMVGEGVGEVGKVRGI